MVLRLRIVHRTQSIATIFFIREFSRDADALAWSIRGDAYYAFSSLPSRPPNSLAITLSAQSQFGFATRMDPTTRPPVRPPKIAVIASVLIAGMRTLQKNYKWRRDEN